MLTADKHNKTFGFIWQFSASLRRQRSLRKDRNGSKHARLMLAHARRKLKARDLKLAVHGSTSMLCITSAFCPPIESTCAVIWWWVRNIAKNILVVAYVIARSGTTTPRRSPNNSTTETLASTGWLYEHVDIFHSPTSGMPDVDSTAPVSQIAAIIVQHRRVVNSCS